MKLIDTHAHLYAPPYEDKVDKVIADSKTQHVNTIYMPNLDLDTIKPMLGVANRHPNTCKAMIGLHPCSVDADFENKLEKMATWLPKHPFVAIGEVGMDLYHDKTYKTQQVQALYIQLSWATQYKLPIVLHCRESLDEVIAIIDKVQDGSLKGIFHCFSGTPSQAQQIIDKGFYLGIGGIATFKGGPLDTILKTVPLENIVLETDSPYLAPMPHRGKVNQPAYLVHIARYIATIKKIPIKKVATITTHNAQLLFENKV